MIHDFSVEELKTVAGMLMEDMRGNWGWNYRERIETTQTCLELLVERDTGKAAQYREDLAVCHRELHSEYPDGREFRDSANLYAYYSEEGTTDRVKAFLRDACTYPECRSIEIPVTE